MNTRIFMRPKGDAFMRPKGDAFMRPKGDAFMRLYIILILGLVSCNKIESITDFDGTFIDSRDNKEYKYVKIGEQTWMAENLRYNTIDSTGWWCYNSAEGNCDTYGRLYSWVSAKVACPYGWHLPTDAEWKKLEIFAGMPASEADSIEWRVTGSVGIALKAKKGWNSGGTGDNSVRFSAIPSGIYEAGVYNFIGDLASFWTSSYTDETHAWGRGLIYHADGIYRWKYPKTSGFSVRCVKN
jgi:uncharacterized protein (TIGR02145 family)